MKLLTRLIVILPLLTLGGCYTQIALRDTGYRDHPVVSEDNKYANEDAYTDSTGNYESENYDSTGNYYPSYRRYYGGYYPPYSLYMGFGYDPFWYDWYGYNYMMPGYYSPWSWYYSPYHFYPYYYGGYQYWGNGYSSPIYKYRSSAIARLRDNSGDRGSTIRGGGYSGESGARSSGSYSTPSRGDRSTDVDLGKVRVSRDGSNSTGTAVLKGSPNTNNTAGKNTKVRTRERNNSTTRSATPPKSKSNSTRGRSSTSSSGRSEKSTPSYTPRSEPRSTSSYSPPPSSSSSRSSTPRSEGSSSSRGSDGGRRR